MYRQIRRLNSYVKSSIGFLNKFNPILKYKIKNGLTIFTFHDVTEEPSEFTKEHGLSLGVEQFNNHIKWVNNNFEIIDPSTIKDNNKKIPKRAAMITFDDGFLGAFENAFPILKDQDIPALMFLNMKPVIERTPMLSAFISYLHKYNSYFNAHMKKINIIPPYHLYINPKIMRQALKLIGNIDLEKINTYQGKLASQEDIEKWDQESIVNYGNHFFDHWNAQALRSDELEDQYELNEIELKKLSSYTGFFAFTNGKPNTCFDKNNVKLLRHLKAKKLFSSVSGINEDFENFLLGRLSINNNDKTLNHLWFRLSQTRREKNS